MDNKFYNDNVDINLLNIDNKSKDNLLIETKQHHLFNLKNILTKHIKEGFDSIYQHTKISNKENKFILKEFQDNLENVPKWNQTIIDKEVKRIKIVSKCDYLSKILETLFSIHLKIINLNTKNIKIPSIDNYIHTLYINSARDFWKKPQLFYHNVNNKRKQLYLQEISNIIKDNIENTIHFFISKISDDLHSNDSNNLSNSKKIFNPVKDKNDILKEMEDQNNNDDIVLNTDEEDNNEHDGDDEQDNDDDIVLNTDEEDNNEHDGDDEQDDEQDDDIVLNTDEEDNNDDDDIVLNTDEEDNNDDDDIILNTDEEDNNNEQNNNEQDDNEQNDNEQDDNEQNDNEQDDNEQNDNEQNNNEQNDNEQNNNDDDILLNINEENIIKNVNIEEDIIEEDIIEEDIIEDVNIEDINIEKKNNQQDDIELIKNYLNDNITNTNIQNKKKIYSISNKNLLINNF
jgi:hypothetical protein